MGRCPTPSLCFLLLPFVEEAGRREPQASYSMVFDANNGLLSTKNACFWKTNL